jgi:2'-5' RNA ligase
MRVFAALPLPPEAVAALQRTIAELASRADRLRWVNPQGLHLTLHFFGELEAEAVARLGSLWDEPALASPPIPSSFGALGQFPERGSPRVVWVGIGRGAGEIVSYQQRLASRLASMGYPPDPRGFSPHVTLARNPGSRLAADWRAGVEPPRLDFAIEHCVLFQSILEPRGARYVALRDARFGVQNRWSR